MSEHTPDLARQLSSHDWGLFGSQGYVLGVDVGSYGLRAVLAQLSGEQIHQRQAEIESDNAEGMVEQALALATDLLDQGGVDTGHLVRIGIGFGGPVDARAGVTLRSHRMRGWERLPLAQRFEEQFNTVALLDNDAKTIALGEATFGAGRDVNNLFYLHLSTGVGGGIVINGQIYHGPRTLAGEIGHAPMSLDGPPCRCGGHGHLESYLAIDGLLRRAGELGLQTSDLRDVFGDHQAGQRTVQEAVQLLGLELARVYQLLDPDQIVVGGIVARIGGDQFVQAIGAQLEQALAPAFRRNIPVVPSTLGIDAVAIGALALALDSLKS